MAELSLGGLLVAVDRGGTLSGEIVTKDIGEGGKGPGESGPWGGLDRSQLKNHEGSPELVGPLDPPLLLSLSL